MLSFSSYIKLLFLIINFLKKSYLDNFLGLSTNHG